jgi:hypothetical protein
MRVKPAWSLDTPPIGGPATYGRMRAQDRPSSWWVVALVLAAATAIAPSLASANHIPGATYTGNVTGGGTVTITISADGGQVASFVVQSVPAPPCTFNTSAPNTPINDHSFTRTTPSPSPHFTGSFPSAQSAAGTLRIFSSQCDTGVRDWSATTAAQPPPGYPRPKGATPFRVSLVPDYNACASPNREHGPPLAFGSCNPPVPASAWLTVGTADANGQATNSAGFVRLKVLVGNPGTPADEADVQVTASITDVRNASGLADYTGEVQVRSTVRITDKLNGSLETESGTVQNTTFPVTVPCVATASTTIGGTCSIATSYDAVVPGAIKEGKRAIWELGRVLVGDGGSDGVVSTTPNGVFAREGVFVP